MTLLLIALAVLAVIGLALLFTWAFWRANHLGENVMFLNWIRCEIIRGHHRVAKHPLGGQRCLDCFLGGEDLNADGHVNPGRRTYQQRRGA